MVKSRYPDKPCTIGLHFHFCPHCKSKHYYGCSCGEPEKPRRCFDCGMRTRVREVSGAAENQRAEGRVVPADTAEGGRGGEVN